MMIPSKEVFTNPPKAVKFRSLADIYAAEDAIKASSNSLQKIPKESGSTNSNITSEHLDFEEMSTVSTSEGDGLNNDGCGELEVSLKDIRLRCKSTKKRKPGAKPIEADDLGEPLIVLKVKKSRSSYAMEGKSIVVEVISEGLVAQGAKGQAEEDAQGVQETPPLQATCDATSSSNNLTNSDAGVGSSIYNVIEDTWLESDMVDNYLNSELSEPLLEVEPIDNYTSKADFVAKCDLFSVPSSDEYPKSQMVFFDKPCADIVESEEAYFPENGQNNVAECKIIDAEVGANPVSITGIAPERTRVFCSFNRACIDCKDDESLYSLLNSEGSLHEDEFTELESDASSVTKICMLPTDDKLICSFKEASMNEVKSGKNTYSPECTHNNYLQSEIIAVQNDPHAVATTENIQGSKDPISSCDETHSVDVESGDNSYSPGGSPKTLHESEVKQSGSHASPVREISPDRENISSSCCGECCNNGEYEDNIYSTESCLNNSGSENTQVEPSTSSPWENACNLTRNGDVESGRDLYSPRGSPNALHERELKKAGSHESLVTDILSDEENTYSSGNGTYGSDIEYIENIYSPESCRNNSDKSKNSQVEASTSLIMGTDSAKTDAVANTHLENSSSDNFDFICQEVPCFLDSTNLRSSEGQLESIVYSAISTSQCFYKKEDDVSMSLHHTPGSPNENSETDNSDEVFEGANQVKPTEKIEKELAGILQLCDNLDKPQSINNEMGKFENQLNGDSRATKEHAPIKLLSNRTIISPASQEKLCQALTDIELCEGAQIPKCKKSIQFENCTRMKKCTITKGLQKTKGVIKKGNLKSTGAACLKDLPAKMDTEKAIEFSRRQMHDFENVTTKLLKSMRFMRGVLEESFNVQSHGFSKYTAEEIKVASENASELERTTKKWLALMSKDCNRFCKILKSAGNSASSPPTTNNGVQNRRKIVFADEAGGVLCHIKVFDEASTPTVETENTDQ